MGTEPSVAVYDTSAQEWMSRRKLEYADRLEQFAARVTAGPVDNGPVADLGCGPGWHVGGLPQPVVALGLGISTQKRRRSSRSMLANVEHPLRVAGDLRALPFRDRCLRGAWASRSYIHLARSELPASRSMLANVEHPLRVAGDLRALPFRDLALADLHRALAPGATVELHLFEGDAEWDERPDDDFPGRRFSRWPVPWLRDVLVGAGLATESVETRKKVLLVAARRLHTLADTVGAGMRLLVCGLNPSVYAADVGVGFARGSNRFWPAALAAGLVSRDRDPRHALIAHGIGMTDLVKRPTRQAAELTTDEYSEGLKRLERLAERLEPGVVCFVGLAGWRAAVDRRAAPGPQTRRIGGRPAYVMPSTSGLNARTSLAELTDHLRAAASPYPG